MPPHKPPRKLPASGAEPVFSDLIYGTPTGRLNNNCYAWAIDAYRDSGNIKLQPGDLSRQSTIDDSSSCAFLRSRALADNRARGISMVDPRRKCPAGYYKIMSFIDKGNDYHWYKQNGDLLYRVRPGDTPGSIARDLGVPRSAVVSPTPSPAPGDLVFVRKANVFSHKQGFATGPLLRDASGRTIPDPRRANRNYGAYDYRSFCGAMCVRNVRPTSRRAARVNAPEARALHALLHKRLRILHPGLEQAAQVGRGRPEVQRRHARQV
jgi:hypothetical protein